MWVAPEERDAFVARLREQGSIREMPLRQLKKSGETWIARVSAEVIEVAGEKCILAHMQDITEQQSAAQALRESEERLRGTLDHMMEGCQIIGRDWRYLYVNDTAARHGNLTKEELLGRTMQEAYPGIENTPLFAAMRRCMEERVPRTMENEFVYA